MNSHVPLWYEFADTIEKTQEEARRRKAIDEARAKVRHGFDELWELEDHEFIRDIITVQAYRLPKRMRLA